jgi:transposase-like protein
MTGTIFHGSKVPLRTWLLVVFEMCASKNGMAAREIQRKYAVAPKTAWFMAHRIREAMRTRAPGALIGTIVADETWIGGDPTNKHGGSAPARARREGVQIKPGEMGTIKTEKTPVLSLIDAETGEVRSRVVANVIGPTLRKVIAEQVNMGRSVLWTDDAAAYGTIGREFLSHSSVNHLQGEYERDGITTNRAEGYFGQLKRSINGTYHHVSEEHLPRYLAEFDFRYSTSDLSDTQRMARLMGQVEDRRISYKRLVW